MSDEMKHKAQLGEISGSLSTGPRYHRDELEEDELVTVDDDESDTEMRIDRIVEMQGDLFVVLIHDDCPVEHLTSVNDINKLEE